MRRSGIIAIISLLLVGCKTRRSVVYVPEVRTKYVRTTDSIHHIDTIVKEKQTTIMMLDSAAMAEYGIKLQAAERAWLVKTKELERELQRISKMKADTVILRDSIPYPVPVPEYIERELSWWQKTQIKCGNVMFGLLSVLVLYGGWRLYRKVRF